MIIRSSSARQSRCIFCSLLRTQSLRTATTRADLAIPRHNLLEERITGPTEAEIRAQKPPPQVWSSPVSKAIVERHKLMGYWSKTVGKLGSTRDRGELAPVERQNRGEPDEVKLEHLMAAQSHMGHSTSLWNPMNSRYIFGARAGIHIISLEATASHLKRAARVVKGVAERGGLVLFVGTRKGQRLAVVKAAKATGGYHLFTRWIPGTITNGQQLLHHCEIQPVDPLDRKIFGYSEEIKEKVPVLKPDLVVCFNPLENKTLLHECALHTIPTIGVIDTDADPTTVTYPIPANDDSLRCIGLIGRVLGRAGGAGRRKRLYEIRRGTPLPYEPFNLNEILFDESGKTVSQKNQAAVQDAGSVAGGEAYAGIPTSDIPSKPVEVLQGEQESDVKMRSEAKNPLTWTAPSRSMGRQSV